MIVFLLVLQLEKSKITIKIRLILFLFALPMEKGMIVLTKSLTRICAITKPNLMVMALLVGKKNKILYI